MSRFEAADLEVEVRLEGEQSFLVIDHRLHPEPGEMAHVEFWRCTSDHEAMRPHLLVVADRARLGEAKVPWPAATLSALIEGLMNGHD